MVDFDAIIQEIIKAEEASHDKQKREQPKIDGVEA